MNQSKPSNFESDCDTALSWIARLRAESVSDLDRQGFALWLAADAGHKQAMDTMLDMWDDLASVRHLPISSQRVQAAANSNHWLSGSIAAAACLVLALFIWPQNQSSNQQWHYQTAVGEQRSVVLADNSTLTLNTNSQVEISFDDAHRYIELIRGEVYFEVAKDAERPFDVDFGSARVTAIGTAFNIYRSDESADITVTEGVVRVTELGDTGGRAPMVETLSANQHISTNQQGLQASGAVDVNNFVAWRKGELIANQMPLPEFVAQLERYQDTHILITDADVAALTVSGVFQLGHPEAILAGLELSHGLKVVTLDSKTLQLLKPQQ